MTTNIFILKQVFYSEKRNNFDNFVRVFVLFSDRDILFVYKLPKTQAH